MLLFLCRRVRIYGNALHFFCNVVVGKLLDDFLCAVDDHIRNTCQFGYLDTVASVSTTLYDLAQKYNVVTFFFDRDTVIVDVV